MKLIFVAVDFSAHSIAAARLAAAIARSHRARLALYHAIDPLTEDHTAQVRHELTRLAEALEIDAVEIIVDHADPVRGILAAAIQRGTDLLAVGCWGSGSGAPYRLGTVAARIARDADCPVLVCHDDHVERFPPDGRFHHPLVAIDYSQFSVPAVRAAAALAQPGVTIELVHVLQAPPGRPASGPELADWIGNLRAEEVARLSAFARDIDVAPVAVEVRAEMGRVAEQILDFARSSSTDLIVVGAHGRESAVELIGTSADRLLRGAPAPVLVLPARTLLEAR